MGFATALVGGALVVGFSIYRKWNSAICMLACTTAVLVVLVTLLVLPSLDEIISVRHNTLGFMAGYPAEPNKVAVFHLPRSYEYGLDYYFKKALPEWTPEKTEVRFVFSGPKGLEELAHYPRFNRITQNKLYMSLNPDNRIFFVDLANEKSSGK